MPLLAASSDCISSPVPGTSTAKDDILVVVTPLSTIRAWIVQPFIVSFSTDITSCSSSSRDTFRSDVILL